MFLTCLNSFSNPFLYVIIGWFLLLFHCNRIFSKTLMLGPSLVLLHWYLEIMLCCISSLVISYVDRLNDIISLIFSLDIYLSPKYISFFITLSFKNKCILSYYWLNLSIRLFNELSSSLSWASIRSILSRWSRLIIMRPSFRVLKSFIFLVCIVFVKWLLDGNFDMLCRFYFVFLYFFNVLPVFLAI